MKLNYSTVGEFIQLSKLRNNDGRISQLLGVNIDKEFIQSISNRNDLDLSQYKVIKKGQFGCSLMKVGRDKKVSVARLSEYDEAIISSAYYFFEVKDENILDPEYLMMWFSRPESDRYQWFQSGADIRGRITWGEFGNLPIKVPSIEKQREIVAEYNTIINRIKLNEELNKRLEKTVQVLYRHWFVDFEFPDKNGQPYKSSGGKMVYNDKLDQEIPDKWKVKSFTEAVNLKGGGTPSTTETSYWDGNIPFFTPKDVDTSYYSFITKKYITEYGLNNCSTRLYPKNTVFVTARGTVGAISLAGVQMAMNQSCYAILADENIGQFYTHQFTRETIKSLKREAIGAVFSALVTKDFEGKNVIIPSNAILKNFNSKIKLFYDLIYNKSKQNISLKNLLELTLSKMSKVSTLQTKQTI